MIRSTAEVAFHDCDHASNGFRGEEAQLKPAPSELADTLTNSCSSNKGELPSIAGQSRTRAARSKGNFNHLISLHWKDVIYAIRLPPLLQPFRTQQLASYETHPANFWRGKGGRLKESFDRLFSTQENKIIDLDEEENIEGRLSASKLGCTPSHS